MLEALGLRCERGARILFDHLSFRVAAGEALRIAGANGSGKTSLLRILCGLLSPTEGEVRWKGESIGRLREDYAGELVYLGHAPAVKDELTPAENLAISCRLAGTAASEEAVQQALQHFGLARLRVPAKRLSQGQRRRAALARLVLSRQRPLWLLDEPFSALDAEGISKLNALIREHRSRGGALVYTTHQDPGLVATRVIELA